MPTRTATTVRLTLEARRGYERACRSAGVTLTALLEAIGLELDQRPSTLIDRGPDIVETARQLDLERRNRRWFLHPWSGRRIPRDTRTR